MADYKGYLKDKDQNKLYVSSNEIAISSEQPTSDDWKLWIDPNDTLNNVGSEVVNNLSGNETNMAPSVKTVNDKFNGVNSMGSIIVEDISCKNVFNEDYAKSVSNYSKFGSSVSPGYNSVPFYLEPNTTYTFSRANSLGVGTGVYCLLKLDGNTNGALDETSAWIIHNESADYCHQAFTFTTSSTGLVLFTVAWMETLTQDFLNTIWDVLKYVQIEKGNKVTPHVPHKEFSNLQHYSTEEQVIGTWINKKPLYRKMFDFGILPASSILDVLHNIQNVEHIHVNLGETFWCYKDISYTTANYCPSPIFIGYIRALTASSTAVTVETVNNDATNYHMLVCLEYTKTTD